jgi:glycine/D-amino acid oxidase-like deaminating enzyme
MLSPAVGELMAELIATGRRPLSAPPAPLAR